MNPPGFWRYIGSTVTTLVILCLFSIPFSYADTFYVNSVAIGADDGTSWSDAYVDLQAAIDAAASGDEVWVAAGTYYPTSWPNGGSDDRERHFSLRNGVSVYGGFSGTETSLSQRDVEINETILSGDIGTEGDDSDNCFHVFYHPERTDLDSSAVLDGFVISGGNANGSSFHDYGGGMYNHSSSPTLTNCTFIKNSGSGMYNDSSFPTLTNCAFIENSGSGMNNDSSSPKLTNCNFSGNSANFGGGMHNSYSFPTLANCTFRGNRARYGGGIYNSHSSPTLINCFFIDNSAHYSYMEMPPSWDWESSPSVHYDGSGGGMYNIISSPSLTNCTFSQNSADYGGGMYNINMPSSSPTCTNCILWNNNARVLGNEVRNFNSTPIFAYCDIKGSFADGAWDESFGTNGGNNIDSDPLFARNPGTNGANDPGDLHLTSDSPCIDAGDPSVTGGQDMDGEVRVFDGDQDGTIIIDIGTDEYIDSDYDGVPNRNEPPGIIATSVSENTREDGASATFDVRLNSSPNGDVILMVESTDNSEGTVSPDTLTFTSFTWSINQIVTAIGVDDDMVDGDQSYFIRVSVDMDRTQDTTGYLDLEAVNISMTNSDDGNDSSSGGSVSSEGGSSGGCFINSLFGAGG